MWNEALSFSTVIVTVSIALISSVIALGRKDRPLRIYATGFASMAAAFVCFTFQAKSTPWLGIIVSNTLVIFFHFCVAWGIRTFCGRSRPWPFRFWLYFAVFLSALMLFTFVHPDFPSRGITVSALIIVLTAEFIAALFRELLSAGRTIRYSIMAFTLLFIVFHGVRIMLLALHVADARMFMAPNPVTTFTLSSTMFFVILLAGSVMILDSARMMKEMEKQNGLLSELALKDGLTGLFNRHFLDPTILVEMQRHDRYKAPLSLIMVDLDHFKRVNDVYGHDAGDAVLMETAKRIRGAVRRSDFLFRWGGEEFLILAPNTDLEGASSLAQKLKEALTSQPIDPVGTQTASFGVAERSEGESRMEWFRRVDKAVYLAKSNGRNRVEVWTKGMAMPPVTVKVEWREEWNSGNETIDREHREILLLGNRLLELSLEENAAEHVESQVNVLVGHIRDHFSDEEKILETAGFPGLAEHRNIHRALLEEAASMKGKFTLGEVDASSFFRFLIEKLVIEHMLSADVLFFPYMRREKRDVNM